MMIRSEKKQSRVAINPLNHPPDFFVSYRQGRNSSLSEREAPGTDYHKKSRRCRLQLESGASTQRGQIEDPIPDFNLHESESVESSIQFSSHSGKPVNADHSNV